MQSQLQGFFGYSSNPSSSGESIEKAVKELNSLDNRYNILTWRSLFRGGSLVISDILNCIDKCDFACFDLTGMNENVLFELGYAIARKKPLWIIFDTSFTESVRQFELLGLLSTISYVKYTNHGHIVTEFGKHRPYEGEEIFTRLLESSTVESDRQNVLLYLKQQIDTTASSDIDQNIKSRKLPVIVDDPAESKVQSLTWYIQHINSSISILAEFSSQYRSGSALQNMKCSFVCGLASGLNKKVLMTAEHPYTAPSDYKSLVKIYNSIDALRGYIGGFLNDTKTETVKAFVSPKLSTKGSRRKNSLQTISFGEWIAEHEKYKIAEYYVEPKHIDSLLKSEHNIIVGRKGCGKTASFYYLEERFSNDVRNIVCSIKPNSFEIDALLVLLRLAQEDYQKYYLIETSWKFLIYTQIASSLYERISNRPSHSLSQTEKEFIIYVDSRKSIILSDFSSRLELQLAALNEELSNLFTESQDKFRNKISERLHNTVLYDIRSFIALLAPKSGKIVVLIDNLDKSWKVNNNLALLSQWVLGLLSVSGRLATEISYVKKKQTSVEFSLTIFLRTDILKRIIRDAREPDKIEKTELKYDDKEMLFMILDERFVTLNEEYESSDEFWRDFICDNVKNQGTQDFIFSKIYPRPRDLLLFMRYAKDTAVARGHSTIEELDLLKAHEQYSEWILSSLFGENGITQEQMENFVYNLIGNSQIVQESDVLTAMALADIDAKDSASIDYFIDHLVALSILGREISTDEFFFEYDLNVDRRNKIMASRLPARRYRIHNALVPALRLSPC
jgi:hypothetical protein